MMSLFVFFFFFNDTATTEIYTLSLHDPLPISSEQGAQPNPKDSPLPFQRSIAGDGAAARIVPSTEENGSRAATDRKSTRLNSSHSQISYAVFCLIKKNTLTTTSSSPRPPV